MTRQPVAALRILQTIGGRGVSPRPEGRMATINVMLLLLSGRDAPTSLYMTMNLGCARVDCRMKESPKSSRIDRYEHVCRP